MLGSRATSDDYRVCNPLYARNGGGHYEALLGASKMSSRLIVSLVSGVILVLGFSLTSGILFTYTENRT